MLEAVQLLRAVWSRSEQGFAELDPIGIHELLGAGDLTCCPLVYSYAYYGQATGDRAALAWCWQMNSPITKWKSKIISILPRPNCAPAPSARN